MQRAPKLEPQAMAPPAATVNLREAWGRWLFVWAAGRFHSLSFCVVVSPAGYLKATINEVMRVVNTLPVTTYTLRRDTCLSLALFFRSACIYIIIAFMPAQSMEFLLRQRIPWLSKVREKLVLQQSMLCASLLTRTVPWHRVSSEMAGSRRWEPAATSLHLLSGAQQMALHCCLLYPDKYHGVSLPNSMG